MSFPCLLPQPFVRNPHSHFVFQQLRDHHGFTNTDGLDASPEMIAEAEKLNVYGKIYCAKIGDGHTVSEIADSQSKTKLV